MRKLIIAVSAGFVVAVTALVLFLVFHKSYSDYADECAAALAHHVKGKPEACRHISKDDYDTLRLAQGLRDSGIIDKHGDVDMGKLLDDE